MKVKFSQLQLKDIQIKKFNLEENTEGQHIFNINMDFEPLLLKLGEHNLDGLLVKIKINDRTRNVKLKVKTELLAVFEFSTDLSKEKKANMLLYNGLAVVYGFLRGLVFQKCSYLPPKDRILPNVNLVDLIKEKLELVLSSKEK
jgi:hypothetical protein